MKKILPLFSIFIIVSLSSCMTIKNKHTIVLVDSPDNLKVTQNGVERKIEMVTAISSSSASGGGVLYKYPGTKIKLHKNTVIELESNGNKGKAIVETKPRIGLLIGQVFFTAGIGTIVDLSTKSYFGFKKNPTSKFVDAKAIVEGTKPRTGVELYKYLKNLDWEIR